MYLLLVLILKLVVRTMSVLASDLVQLELDLVSHNCILVRTFFSVTTVYDGARS